jgi:hypothetical protein
MSKKILELEAQVSQYKKYIEQQKKNQAQGQKSTVSVDLPKPSPLTVETKPENSQGKSYLTP